MKIIIDTNIYLNFYRLQGKQSIKMLQNLIKLLEDKKIQLVLPKQIEDEFIRNKESVYSEHVLKFAENLSVKLTIPLLIKDSPNVKQLNNVVKRLNVLSKKVVEDYKKRVLNSNSKINKLLNKLFGLAIKLEDTGDILQLAYFRTLRGNPPRKKNSTFGDAIIWESILENCIDDDLVFISGDGDFESAILSGQMDELLKIEWERKTGKKFLFYKELGSFINENIKDQKELEIKKEIIEEETRLNALESIDYALESYKRIGKKISNRLSVVDYFNKRLVSVSSGVENICVCCGARGDLPSFAIGKGEYKCENCRNKFTSGKTCSNCGRHFHKEEDYSLHTYSVTSFSNSIDLCEPCNKKII